MPGSTFLEGERVTLRTIERDDIEVVQRSRNDPEVRVPLGLTHPQNETQVEESFEEWIESEESISLCVCLDEEPIGEVSIMHLDWTRPDLAYWLLPEHRGEGYATEALSLLLEYFFESFEKRGVTARVFETNSASSTLLERLGFTEEGRLREHRFVEGEYVDVAFYGLLREEWEEKNVKAEEE